jgi:hypothetical protein
MNCSGICMRSITSSSLLQTIVVKSPTSMCSQLTWVPSLQQQPHIHASNAQLAVGAGVGHGKLTPVPAGPAATTLQQHQTPSRCISTICLQLPFNHAQKATGSTNLAGPAATTLKQLRHMQKGHLNTKPTMCVDYMLPFCRNTCRPAEGNHAHSDNLQHHWYVPLPRVYVPRAVLTPPCREHRAAPVSLTRSR